MTSLIQNESVATEQNPFEIITERFNDFMNNESSSAQTKLMALEDVLAYDAARADLDLYHDYLNGMDKEEKEKAQFTRQIELMRLIDRFGNIEETMRTRSQTIPDYEREELFASNLLNAEIKTNKKGDSFNNHTDQKGFTRRKLLNLAISFRMDPKNKQKIFNQDSRK